MRIAICLFNYYPYGGLEQDCLAVIKTALASGHEVEVFTGSWEGKPPEGMGLTLLQAGGFSNHGRCKRFYTMLKEILPAYEMDCVVGFNRIPGLDFYFNADVSFVAKSQEKHGFFYKLTRRYRIFAKFEEAVFSTNSDTHIFSIAPRIRKEYQRLYQTNDKRFIDVPPGINKEAIDAARSQRAIIRQQLAITADEKLVVMVGSDFERKGVDRAITALSALQDQKCHLAVIGKGNSDKFIMLADKLGIQNQVHFLGGRSNVPEYLAAADLLLHPARTETAGNAILEGLVAHLPVIVTRSCGFAYHIQQADSGIVVDDQPFEQQQLDAALKRGIDALPNGVWQRNAEIYAQQQDLYSRAESIVHAIESTKKKSN